MHLSHGSWNLAGLNRYQKQHGDGLHQLNIVYDFSYLCLLLLDIVEYIDSPALVCEQTVNLVASENYPINIVEQKLCVQLSRFGCGLGWLKLKA